MAFIIAPPFPWGSKLLREGVWNEDTVQVPSIACGNGKKKNRKQLRLEVQKIRVFGHFDPLLGK